MVSSIDDTSIIETVKQLKSTKDTSPQSSSSHSDSLLTAFKKSFELLKIKKDVFISKINDKKVKEPKTKDPKTYKYLDNSINICIYLIMISDAFYESGLESISFARICPY